MINLARSRVVQVATSLPILLNGVIDTKLGLRGHWLHFIDAAELVLWYFLELHYH